MAAATKLVNPNSEVVARSSTLMVNISAARGLQQVLKSNLGPRGTLKMLVGGAGQIKLTKDGAVLLHEMQIQHPTASLIARTATAQDDMTGDGTTSVVMLTGELLKQAERFTQEGLHPRIICEGYDLARDHIIAKLDEWKVPLKPAEGGGLDREILESVARTSLRTKLNAELAETLVDAVTQAVMCVHKPDEAIDLHMVEIMCMRHKSGSDSRFVNGLVLDHGSRHPDMPTSLTNCHVLTCNVSLEYEKSEVAAGFYYSNADEREKMIESERKFTDDKCRQLIEFKRSVCKEGESFVVINQKGIDPLSLDMLAKEGIYAARRAKRRNMERLTLSCGGMPVNSFDDIDASCLGHCGKLSEMTLGDDKFCFIEDVANPLSCSILIKGPNQHTLDQIKDALRDGLRAVKNTVDDGAVVPGGGAFEIAAAAECYKYMAEVPGKARLGVQAFADALLVIPKLLCENSGFDVQDSIIKIQNEHAKTGALVGLDIITGEPVLPETQGVWDNWIVKRQFMYLSTVLATQLLLVDEVMKAGKRMGGGGGPEEGGEMIDQ